MVPHRIGHVLDGRYELREQIASGAMGLVYRAERRKLGRAVAVKFLHAESASDEHARRRFEVEAMAMAHLNHPSCASVIDYGVSDGVPFVVMDLAPGVNLRALIDQGPLPVEGAVAIMRQVLAGLQAAHELGIVHRDVKPANIMVHEMPGSPVQVKLVDFGLAHWDERRGDLTAAGIAIGTPAYMAPEQCRAETADARSDLYACSVVLFEMITGEKPFSASETIELMRLHEKVPPPRLARAHRGGHSFGSLENVVARALAKRRDARFQSATDMIRALDDAMRSLEHADDDEPTMVARRHGGPVRASGTYAVGSGLSSHELGADVSRSGWDAGRSFWWLSRIAGAVVVLSLLVALVAEGPGRGPPTVAMHAVAAAGPGPTERDDADDPAATGADAAQPHDLRGRLLQLVTSFSTRHATGTGIRCLLDRMYGQAAWHDRNARHDGASAAGAPASCP